MIRQRSFTAIISSEQHIRFDYTRTGYSKIIFPDFSFKLLVSVIPSLLARATIWGMGDLAYWLVLAATGLNCSFLLLVAIKLVFSALQNHLLNFWLLTQDFVNFSKILFLCSAWVLMAASLKAQLQGVPLKSPPLNFSKCQIVENMAES